MTAFFMLLKKPQCTIEVYFFSSDHKLDQAF